MKWWNGATTMRMEEEVLVMETMSSEDSCYKADEDGKEALTSYKIKKLPWESTALRKIKKQLDKKYNNRLSKRARDRIVPRTLQSRQNVTLLKFLNGPLMLKHQILILQPLHLCDCRTIFISWQWTVLWIYFIN